MLEKEKCNIAKESLKYSIMESITTGKKDWMKESIKKLNRDCPNLEERKKFVADLKKDISDTLNSMKFYSEGMKKK